MGVTDRQATVRPARPVPLTVRRLRWPAATAAGTVIVFWCALREARTTSVQSDGASIALQAWAMLHGNLLLHGWSVADVSYYTTELPEYMLAEAVRGMTPEVVHVCAALTYTLLVLLAAFVARGRARGLEGLLRVAITVAIMLGPSLTAAAALLNVPDHAGTAVPVLAALALIDCSFPYGGKRTPRTPPGRRWWVPPATAVLLGWALVGDPLVLLIGVAPLLLVCGARSVRLLVQRRVPLAEARHEVSLTAAAVAAVLVSDIITHVVRILGGFTASRGPNHFVLSGTMINNVPGLVTDYLGLFSADFFGERFGPGLIVTGIHLVAAVAVAAAVVLALRRFFWGDDLVIPLLATAIVVNIAAFSVIYEVAGSTMREITPVFALGAALAGRLFAGPVLRGRLEPVLGCCLAAALLAAAPPVLLARPAPLNQTGLVAWLEQRHLSQGAAGYWDASSVTVASGGRVTMRAVIGDRAGTLAPYTWELNRALLDSRADYVNFIVATAPHSAGGATVTQRQAIATFGPPYRRYVYAGYTILVWRKNLLTDLARNLGTTL
jgi:hypothetical protein